MAKTVLIILTIILLAVSLTKNSSEMSKSKLTDFLKQVDLDIASSFGLSMENLRAVDEKPLYGRQDETYSKTLLDVRRIVMDGQSYGDIKPSIYLENNHNSGYIFVKKADGTNYLYTIKYHDGWSIVKQDKKQSKKMTFNNETERPLNFSPLSEKQIKTFIKQRGITPLAIKAIGNYTVILFRTTTKQGEYELTSDQSGRIHESSGFGSNNSDVTPVSLGSGGCNSQAGKIAFAEIIINQDELLKKAAKLEVIFGDNTKVIESINDKKGLIIPNPTGSTDVSNIYIYDNDGKILFEH